VNLVGPTHASRLGVAHPEDGHSTPAVRGGAADTGSPAVSPRRGLHREHGGGSGVAPGRGSGMELTGPVR
jgi:hypothetical protein